MISPVFILIVPTLQRGNPGFGRSNSGLSATLERRTLRSHARAWERSTSQVWQKTTKGATRLTA